VAGDKEQWGFVLQGMKPAVAQAAEWWQGAVLITFEWSCATSSIDKAGPDQGTFTQAPSEAEQGTRSFFDYRF
jgi:hypothetical protein